MPKVSTAKTGRSKRPTMNVTQSCIDALVSRSLSTQLFNAQGSMRAKMDLLELNLKISKSNEATLSKQLYNAQTYFEQMLAAKDETIAELRKQIWRLSPPTEELNEKLRA